MNYLKKQRIYSVLICSLLLGFSAHSQDSTSVFALAKQMQLEGNYNASIKLFQRVSFFGNGYKNTECYLNIADAYFNLNDYGKAAEFYELAYFSTSNDSIRNLIALSKSAIFIYEKKYLEALQELFSTNEHENNNRLKNIYLGISYYGLNKFEECQSILISTVTDSLSKIQIEKLIAKAERAQKLNPKTAKILSIIIPGMGQFYAGDIKNGINSLLITSAFMYLTISTTFEYSIFEATSVLPWYSRYYMGGFNRAQTITINRIEEKQYDIFVDLMKILEKEN